ncbi:Calx-beta domain-containing protein [Luteolibacter soli]|uniref:Calx-beta domain-containing protein n=1 Tax=Luteolibacter soli TaxID=3135280 RepID=A0ABU9B455_9BACT
MSLFNFRAIALISLLAALPAEAQVPFIPQPVAEGSLPAVNVVHGGTWVAYRTDFNTVRIADRTTGLVIRTLTRPADDAPIAGSPGSLRDISNFGSAMAAEGDYLAVFCDSFVTHTNPPGANSGVTAIVYQVSTGTLVGSADLAVGGGVSNSFCGLSNGRLLVSDPVPRKLHLWNVATMAELPTLTIPAEFPYLNQQTFAGGNTAAMAGDHVVYYAAMWSGPQKLVDVNLATGTFTALPLPEDFNSTEVGASFAMNGSALIFTARTGSPYPFPSLLHYNLATSQLSARSDFTADNYYQAQLRPVIAANGNWHATLSKYGNDVLFLSGTSASAAYQASLFMGSLGPNVASPYAFVDGDLWFLPADSALSGTVSYRMPAGGLPETKLSGQCLPAHESDGILKVQVSLSETDTSPVSFRLRTSNGSATSPADFTAVDQVYTIAAGQTTKVIDVPLTQDQVIEGNESLFVELSEPSANALLTSTRFAGVIRGSSFNLLSPVAPWVGSEAKATGVSLAGGRLIQTNQWTTAPSSQPAVLTKPFDSGDWTAANWNRAVPQTGLSFLGNANGRALLREYAAITVYDPVTDQVVFRKSSDFGDNGTEAFSDTHVVTGIGTDASFEYSLTPPHTTLKPERNLFLSTAAYTQDFLIMTEPGGSLRKYSRTDGSDLGLLISPGPWNGGTPTLAADGNLLVMTYHNKVWFCNVTTPQDLKQLFPLNGSFGDVGRIDVDGGRIFVTDRRYDGHPVVRIFESSTSVEIDMLLGDLAATVLPGSAELPDSLETPRFQLAPFAVEGTKAVTSFEWDGFRIARFSQGTDLPSLVTPDSIRENDGTLQVSFTEAAPYPITVTCQVIAAGRNEAADWAGTGIPVVVPAGTTTFDSGLSVVNDYIPEEDLTAALEITLTGNGKTEVRRVSVGVTDDDLISVDEIGWVEKPMGRNFAPVGDGWAYQSRLDGAHLVSWTEDPTFSQISPVGTMGAYSFAFTMAGTGDYLAVTQENYGRKLGNELPSRVYVYRPGDRKTPFYYINGQKYLQRFGDELYTRGNHLWIGAPGSEAFVTEKKSPGAAYLYDIRTGKKLKTIKAPKGQTMSFGETITENDQSVWIAAPWINNRSGAVFQYSMPKGKLLRTLATPSPGAGRFFGEEMVSTADLLIASSKPTSAPDPEFRGAVQGYSATTGALLWTGTPTDEDEYIGYSLAILPGNVLAVGGSSLYLYELSGTLPPHLIVQIKGGSQVGFYDIQLNGEQLACQQNDIFDQAKAKVIDLRDIPQLQPFLPAPIVPTVVAQTIVTTPSIESQPLVLTKSASGWTLTLPLASDFSIPSGGVIHLENSGDLLTWNPVAKRDTSGNWDLLPEHGMTGSTLSEDGSLAIPSEAAGGFFRLRWD